VHSSVCPKQLQAAKQTHHEAGALVSKHKGLGKLSNMFQCQSDLNNTWEQGYQHFYHQHLLLTKNLLKWRQHVSSYRPNNLFIITRGNKHTTYDNINNQLDTTTTVY